MNHKYVNLDRNVFYTPEVDTVCVCCVCVCVCVFYTAMCIHVSVDTAF